LPSAIAWLQALDAAIGNLHRERLEQGGGGEPERNDYNEYTCPQSGSDFYSEPECPDRSRVQAEKLARRGHGGIRGRGIGRFE
jgi:hypothetical protein